MRGVGHWRGAGHWKGACEKLWVESEEVVWGQEEDAGRQSEEASIHVTYCVMYMCK